jgi:hypothetical protein
MQFHVNTEGQDELGKPITGTRPHRLSLHFPPLTAVYEEKAIIRDLVIPCLISIKRSQEIPTRSGAVHRMAEPVGNDAEPKVRSTCCRVR